MHRRLRTPSSARKRPSALAALRLLISTASRSDRFGLAVSLLLGLASSVLAAIFPLLFGYLVDASLHRAGASIIAFAVAIGLVQAGSGAARSFGAMLSWNLWERMTVAIDEMLVGLTTRLGCVDRLERPEFQERLTLLRTNREHFQESMISLQGAVFLGLQVLVTIAILITVAPLLLLLPLFSAAPIVASRWAERRAQRALRESAADIRSADGFALLAVDATAAGELRVLRLRDLVLRRHRAAWDRAVDRQWRAELVGTLVSTAALLLFTMGFAAAVLYVTTRSLHGHTTLGAVVLVLTAGQQLHNQIGALLGNASALFRIVETMRHLQWLRQYVDEHEQRGTVSPPTVLRHGVRLHDVRFRYAGADRDAVSGVDLELPAGAVVAIVGDNGAGKSTLVSLLCALHEPTAGRISVDGVDLLELDARGWRQSVTAAFQEFVRYELVARQSVGVGQVQFVDDTHQVRSALRRADVAALEAELPDGLATPLGRAFLDGVDLSGGQWQKLALARSMMRDQPLVRVLDEPTYSLDVESERQVFDWFSRMASADSTAGTITVIVSHRFSTVRAADLVAVMDEGGLVEAGTHSELLARGGRYAEMYTTQARGYQ